MSAQIEWLKSRWLLPEDRTGDVRALLDAMASGSTAHEIACKNPADFGAAACGPSDFVRRPLVLVEFGGKTFLQTNRMFCIERDVADGLLSLAGEVPLVAGAAGTGGVVVDHRELFPDAEPDSAQTNAVDCAFRRRLTVLTGGPGTGKTFTLARILAAALKQGFPLEKIRLAAPTGKAAQRMGQALAAAGADLPESFAFCKASLRELSLRCRTLHSLVGFHPTRGRIGNRLLPEGAWIVVDECSMIEIEIWKELLAILPVGGRLLLIGDPEQLESVGAGSLFQQLCGAAGGSLIERCLVHLKKSHRFQDHSDIEVLANAIRSQEESAVLALMDGWRRRVDNGVEWLSGGRRILGYESLPDRAQQFLRELVTAPNPLQAVEELGKFCILCAQKDEVFGAAGINRELDAWFTGNSEFQNRPILITRNDASTGLQNGMVGILRVTGEGEECAWFSNGAGGVDSFPRVRLPEHQSAWAITIHRSQGSEYEEVLVMLPREESPLATKALLYTAVTRARRKVLISGTEEALLKAVRTPSARCGMIPYFLSVSGKVTKKSPESSGEAAEFLEKPTK